MDTDIVNREGGKSFNRSGEEVIVCHICNHRNTTMLVTKECDRCHELKVRIRMDPKIARKLLIETEKNEDK